MVFNLEAMAQSVGPSTQLIMLNKSKGSLANLPKIEDVEWLKVCSTNEVGDLMELIGDIHWSPNPAPPRKHSFHFHCSTDVLALKIPAITPRQSGIKASLPKFFVLLSWIGHSGKGASFSLWKKV